MAPWGMNCKLVWHLTLRHMGHLQAVAMLNTGLVNLGARRESEVQNWHAIYPEKSPDSPEPTIHPPA